MIIQFLNWEKYQRESKRYQSTTWFALNNQLWQSPLWDDMSDTEFRGFIFLLCQVSQRSHQDGVLEMNESAFARLSGLPKKVFPNLIEVLCNHRVITVNSPGNHGAITVLHNTTEHNTTEPPCIKKLWNEHVHHTMPKIRSLSTGRKKIWGQRWRDALPDGFDGTREEYWVKLLKAVASSKVCQGQNTMDGWVANIDWFLRPDTHVKLFEGGYMGVGAGAKVSQSEDAWV